MRTEILRRAQIDPSASEQSRKLGFDGRKADQSRFHAGRELDENIEVSIRSCVVLQRRAEQGQSLDGVSSTEFGELIAILCQRMNHGAPSLLQSHKHDNGAAASLSPKGTKSVLS